MSEHSTEVEDFDIKYWLFKVLGFWYLFVIAFLLATGGAYLYMRYTERTYRVSSTILVADESSSNDLSLDALSGLTGGRRNFGRSGIESELSIIKSFDLLRSTLDTLNFQVAYFTQGDVKSSEIFRASPITVRAIDFENQTRGNIYFEFKGNNSYQVFLDENPKRWTCEFGKPCVSDFFAFTATVRDAGLLARQRETVFIKIFDLDKLTVQYINKLNVESREGQSRLAFGSNIIDINIAGQLIDKNTIFLNTLIQSFIDYDLRERNSIANNTIGFIDTQLKIITDSLEAVEDGLERFRSAKGIIDLSSKGELLLSELTSLESQKSAIDLSLKYYEFLSDYLDKSDSAAGQVVSPSTAGITDPTLIGLITELNVLLSHRVKLLVTEGEKSNVLVATDDQIADIKGRIQENIKNSLVSSQLSYQQIDDQLDALRAEVSLLPKNERELLIIQRNFNINNELYTFLIKKKSESEIARAGNKPKVKVLDEARDLQAQLIGPIGKKIYLQANALAFIAVLGLIGLRLFFQNTVNDLSQIKEKGTVTVLGQIPHVSARSKSGNSAIISPKSPLSEAFRALRLNLDFVVPKKNQTKVIGITSAEGGEGKTFSALNLAQVFAVSGQRTMLIGLDLRKPKLQSELDLTHGLGLSNYLIDSASTEDIIQASGVEGLDVIASGPIPPNPAELIGGSRFPTLLEELSGRYDCIICDAPPIGLVTDYISVSAHMDTTLYVVRLKYSHQKSTELLTGFVEKGVIKSAHMIINDVKRSTSKKYGYGYGYGSEASEKPGFLARVLKR
jgi:capsular exopolysaccharide synthesis family protein